jgi:hypothetical protein
VYLARGPSRAPLRPRRAPRSRLHARAARARQAACAHSSRSSSAAVVCARGSAPPRALLLSLGLLVAATAGWLISRALLMSTCSRPAFASSASYVPVRSECCPHARRRLAWEPAAAGGPRCAPFGRQQQARRTCRRAATLSRRRPRLHAHTRGLKHAWSMRRDRLPPAKEMARGNRGRTRLPGREPKDVEISA